MVAKTPIDTVSTGATFVLIHGACHGGWCWSRVAQLLRSEGHMVFTPTQTGLGERSHLLRPDIGIETFVDDIVNVLEYEELSDVILVGHSFGGIATSGTADRVGDRIAHVVYLDAAVVPDGESALSGVSAQVFAERTATQFHRGVECLQIGPPDVHVTDRGDVEWLNRHLTPHPLRTYLDAVHLEHQLGNGLPCTYVACTRPLHAALAASRELARSKPDWTWREIETGHDAMVTDPGVVAQLLLEIAGARSRSLE